MLNTNETRQAQSWREPEPKTTKFRVVNARGTVIDGSENLTLSDAEQALYRAVCHGHNAYIEEEPTPVEKWQAKGLSEDEIRSLVGIGFCQPKFYKRSVWKKAKALMDELAVPLGLAFPYDYGYGKGKYKSELGIEEVKSKIVELIFPTTEAAS